MKLIDAECNHDEDDGTAHVWFMDRSQVPPRYFTFCRDLSEQSSKVYYERDDQKWGTYGLACKASLQLDGLKIRLPEDVSRSLGITDSVEVSFILSSEKLNKLEERLVMILGREQVTR
jgi:hypothetical protein